MSNDKILLTIDDIGAEGEGIAHLDGATYFVPFALVGEKVLVKEKYRKKNLVFAMLHKVLVPSPSRVTPPCEYFTVCGGCDYQHLAYQEQLRYKSQSVANNLKKIANYNIDIVPIVPCDRLYAYRNKLQMPICEDENGLKIGFYQKNSHNVINLSHCDLHESWADKLIYVVKKFAKQYNVSGYNENTGRGILRHVVARNFNNLCVTVVATKSLVNAKELYDMLCQEFKQPSLFVNINNSKTNVILGKNFTHVGGPATQTTNVLGIETEIFPNSFMQVNDNVRDKMYLQAVKLCGQANTLIDAYSGAGLLSALLAPAFCSVYDIEIVKDACDSANLLAQKLNLQNKISVLCGDCALLLPDLFNKLRSQNVDDTVLLLDPPRKGCGAEVMNAVLLARPKRIIYVSCNSATLSRDIAPLMPYYDISFLSCYDMFPQTSNVETLCQLSVKG